MIRRTVFLGSLVALTMLIGCGDDGDDAVDTDAGVDGGGGNAGTSTGGKGGSGGRAGSSGTGTGGTSGGGAGGTSGTGAGGDGATKYKIGVDVSGLSGSGLVLQNNGGDDLSISQNGAATFATELEKDADYAVTVKTQPSNPMQGCSVANGTGKVGTSDVTLQVTCATGMYTVGGTVSGLTTNGLKLKNNGGDELAVNSGATTFTFATSINAGAAYAVTVSAQPTGQSCKVDMGSGNVGSGNVTNVAVSCVNASVLSVEGLFSSAVARWTDSGASSYTLRGTTNATCDTEAEACADEIEVLNATQPYTVPNLTKGTVYYFQLTATHSGDLKVRSNKAAARPSTPSFDGDVNAVVSADNVTYVGGDFGRLSVYTGGAVPIDRTTGVLGSLPNFPIIDGEIYAVAADGSGGYYVGGSFQNVGGTPHVNLAHIKSDGTLDTAWAPAPDSVVYHLLVKDNTVYVAGSFANIGATPMPRARLAAINMAGEETAWAPNPDAAVNALALSGSDLVVGGAFANISGAAHNRLVMYSTADPPVLNAAWAPNPDADVTAIAARGTDSLFIGGYFQNIGSTPAQRHNVAEINKAGAGTATAFDPDPDQHVTALAWANDTLYLSGGFTEVGSSARLGLAAVGGDGMLKPWDPQPNAADTVYTLLASGDTVYLGGDFSSIGGMPRNKLAAVESSGNGAARGWNPNPDGGVNDLVLVGESVVVAGDYDGLGGLARARLAAFKPSGEVTTWNPGADNVVHALAITGTTVYVGGEFTQLGGMARNHIGSVDAAGTLNTWDPNADGNVFAIALEGSNVYVGGAFANVGGAARAAIAKLASGSNSADATWNPGASGGEVRALAATATLVYAGGTFTMLGGAGRNRIGACAATGAGAVSTTWNPNADDVVYAIAVKAADAVYVGGSFANIGSTPTARANLAEIDENGAVTGFAPAPDGDVRALTLASDILYVGGEFLNVAGPANRNRATAYDTASSNALVATWYPNIQGNVRAIAVSDAVYLGGDFTHVDQVYSPKYAKYMKATP